MTDDKKSGEMISPAARRALDEAAQRRRSQPPPPVGQAEKGGRRGLEPTRFGDWEKNGLTSDF